jgi:hypothetical protein
MNKENIDLFIGRRVKLVRHRAGSPISTEYVGMLAQWDDMMYQLGPVASATRLPNGVLNGSGPLAANEIESIDVF